MNAECGLYLQPAHKITTRRSATAAGRSVADRVAKLCCERTREILAALRMTPDHWVPPDHSVIPDPRVTRGHWAACYDVCAMPVKEKTQLMSATEIDRTVQRLAHEIVEKSGRHHQSRADRHPAARRAAGAAHRARDARNRRRGGAGGHAGHHALPRRSFQGCAAAGAAFQRDSVPGGRQGPDPGGRRALYRAHHARGDERPVRSGPAAARAAVRAD